MDTKKSTSTKIELEFPYNKDWKRGYIVTNSENRRNVILYNDPKDRSTTALARYRLAVSLGRYLTDDEEADHKDNDKTNDDISNLQILTQHDNIIKQSNFAGGSKWVEIECPVCERCFIVRYSNICTRPYNYGRLYTCSKKCFGVALSMYKLSKQDKQELNYKSIVRFVKKFK